MAHANRIEWSTRENRSTVRQNGKCGGCKVKFSRLVERVSTGTYRSDQVHAVSRKTDYYLDGEPLYYASHTVACACGGRIVLRDVRGTYNDGKKCGARCRNAIGPSCDCQCKGRNHGAGHER